MNVYLFMDPRFRPLDAVGGIMPGCYLQFFESETDTPTPVYADADLSSELGTEVDSVGDGGFPFMYMDPEVTYRVKLFNALDVLQYDLDPYTPPRDYPPGTVMWFYGDATARDAAYPPALWQILDGNNGAPDARDRVMVVAGGTYEAGDTGGTSPGSANTGDAGGHDHTGDTGEVTLDSSNVPAHTHRLWVFLSGSQGNAESFATARGVTGDDDHSYPASYGYLDQTVDGNDLIEEGGGSGSPDPHSHTISAELDHHHSVDIDLPPFIAMWALMRRS